MPNHNVKAIANEFLKRAKFESRSLTNMQLKKLPYIAHGWGLALYGRRLVSAQAEAWPYGPVYPELYKSLRQYGPLEVADMIHENDGDPYAEESGPTLEAHLDKDETDLVNGVWEGYKKFDAFQLSNMTHRVGTPWTKTWESKGRAPIDDEDIKAHYQALIAERTSVSS